MTNTDLYVQFPTQPPTCFLPSPSVINITGGVTATFKGTCNGDAPLTGPILAVKHQHPSCSVAIWTSVQESRALFCTHAWPSKREIILKSGESGVCFYLPLKHTQGLYYSFNHGEIMTYCFYVKATTVMWQKKCSWNV